jgi:hypothetical protein
MKSPLAFELLEDSYRSVFATIPAILHSPCHLDSIDPQWLDIYLLHSRAKFPILP